MHEHSHRRSGSPASALLAWLSGRSEHWLEREREPTPNDSGSNCALPSSTSNRSGRGGTPGSDRRPPSSPGRVTTTPAFWPARCTRAPGPEVRRPVSSPAGRQVQPQRLVHLATRRRAPRTACRPRPPQPSRRRPAPSSASTGGLRCASSPTSPTATYVDDACRPARG